MTISLHQVGRFVGVWSALVLLGGDGYGSELPEQPSNQALPPAVLSAAALELGLGGTGGVNVLPETKNDVEKPKALWTRKMSGAISSLAVSKNGKAILVSTNPDRDLEGSSDRYLLTRLNSNGMSEWQQPVKAPIKELDVSDDGSLTVVTNYDNSIIGLNTKGKVTWQSEGTCRPYILNKIKKVLCYHDDDAEPDVAYDLLSWNGKKEFSYKISQDVLAFKFSIDQKNLVFGLSQGQLVVMKPDFKTVASKTKIEGEIIDVAVANEGYPLVSVLYKDARKYAKIGIYQHKQEAWVGSFQPSFRAAQMEMDPEGKFVSYYGNTPQGQSLGKAQPFFAKESNQAQPKSWQENWTRAASYFVDYTYLISISSQSHTLWMGYEETRSNERQSHLLGFDYEGNLRKDCRVSREMNAYLYTYKVASHLPMVVVGTDDGSLSAFADGAF